MLPPPLVHYYHYMSRQTMHSVEKYALINVHYLFKLTLNPFSKL